MTADATPPDSPRLVSSAALYALLSWFFAVSGSGGSSVLLLCLAPFVAALVLLHFTTPPVARRGYAAGAIVMLLVFGGSIVGSHDPKAGQLWWLYLFSVALAAVGTGLDATALNRLLRRETTLPRSVLATLAAGFLPTVILVVLTPR